MPTLISPAELREHVETDLKDTALQRILDDIDGEIVTRFGAHTGAVTIDEDTRGEGLIFLNPPSTAITSVTEYAIRSDTAGILLDPADYRVLRGGRELERLTTGPNGSLHWGERVVVIYTPSDDRARRRMVEIDAAKLEIQYEAKRSEGIGDMQTLFLDHQQERERIIGRLRKGRLSFA